MTTILDRLRTHARANSGQFQVCLSIQEVREIVRALEEQDRLRAAVELCLIGGNHIASELIGALGPAFSAQYPPGTPHDVVREAIGYGNAYEMWCCWDAGMRARNSLEPLSSPAEVAAFIDSMDSGTKRIEG